MKESDIEDKNFLTSLQSIDRYRICFTVHQLETILCFKDPIFNKIFIDLCDLELTRKKGKSLNFFDLSNLIEQARNDAKKKNQINKEFKKITFSKKKVEHTEESEERSDDISGLMESIEPEVKKRLDNLDLRLKSIENRLTELEESCKSIKGSI